MTYLSVNLKNARHNYNVLSNIKTPICVVKKDAYGHGMVSLSKLYQSMGTKFFAVSSLDEAITLKTNDIMGDVLIMGYTNPNNICDLIRYDITQSCFSLCFANRLNEVAKRLNKRVKVHLKIDTGMHRFGFDIREGFLEICKVKNLKNIAITGLYTHFSSADDKDFTLYQYNLFNTLKSVFDFKKLTIHLSNTTATSKYNFINQDFCRCGLFLYGFGNENALPLFTFKTQIDHILHVKKGDKIGYDGVHKFADDTHVAVLPVGYANGFCPPNNTFSVKIKGQSFKVVGKVCMNHCFVDILNNNFQVGETVTLLDSKADFLNLASLQKMSIYQLLCSLGNQNKKIYVD